MKYTTTQLVAEVEKAGEHFQSLYLEWVNDYLTIPHFALDHNMTEKQARIAIDLGRRFHSKLTSK